MITKSLGATKKATLWTWVWISGGAGIGEEIHSQRVPTHRCHCRRQGRRSLTSTTKSSFLRGSRVEVRMQWESPHNFIFLLTLLCLSLNG